MYSIRRFQFWLFLVFIVLSMQSCFADVTDAGNAREVTLTGVLKKQRITVYMYGEYVLVDPKGKTICALKQGNTDLERYLGRTVTIKGIPIKGYPVDFGPPFIEVKSVLPDTRERSKSPPTPHAGIRSAMHPLRVM